MPTWTFVRHGQSVANAAGVFAGRVDSPLTPLGRQQAREARPRLTSVSFARVLASDLSRARDTAALLLEGSPLSIGHHAALQERYCGSWEGRSFAEAESAGDMDVFRSWTGRPPGGESLCEVAVRALKFLQGQDSGDDTLVVCHGALIRAVVGVMDGTDPERIGAYKPANLEFVSRTVPTGGLGDLVNDLR